MTKRKKNTQKKQTAQNPGHLGFVDKEADAADKEEEKEEVKEEEEVKKPTESVTTSDLEFDGQENE